MSFIGHRGRLRGAFSSSSEGLCNEFHPISPSTKNPPQGRVSTVFRS